MQGWTDGKALPDHVMDMTGCRLQSKEDVLTPRHRDAYERPASETCAPAPARTRRLGAWLTALALLCSSGHAAAELFSRDQRLALDLSAYVVTDRGAGYFDVAARRAFLESTDNALLRQRMAELGGDVACDEKLALPVLDDELRLPMFYEETEAWRAAIDPLFAFEDAVSDLAGGFMATGNRAFAGCLLDLLGQWAAADALMKFAYTPENLQAWFNIEDMLFAAGLAYAVVRDQIPGRTADQRRIEDWLVAAAHNHLEIPGGPDSCCNNHLYRRALYATIIGVFAGRDELFQVGVGALLSALHEMNGQGALPREVARGKRAAHYQNYALLYLVPIAQIIERQGYPAFSLEVGGRTLHDAVEFTIDVLYNPTHLGDLAPFGQNLWFIEDDQYFAWMEIYLARFDAPRMNRWIELRRPLYNRSAGGYTTLYFWDPGVR